MYLSKEFDFKTGIIVNEYDLIFEGIVQYIEHNLNINEHLTITQAKIIKKGIIIAELTQDCHDLNQLLISIKSHISFEILPFVEKVRLKSNNVEIIKGIIEKIEEKSSNKLI